MVHEWINQAWIKGLHALIKISFKAQKLKRIASVIWGQRSDDYY